MTRFFAILIALLANVAALKGAGIYYWYNIGPQSINTLNTNQIVIERDIGRVTTVAVDPSNSAHWLIGAAQGGVWETSDSGTTWNPRTDDQASLAMGAIAFAPGDPSVVYAGTGEANFRGDAYAGAGLLVSRNGGTSWQMLNTNFAKTSFSRIRIDSVNSSNLVAATARGGGGVGEESSGHGNVPGAPPRGVFLSTNGGTDFTRALTGEATALEANPNNFNQQYAGLGEIYGDAANSVYRTTNGWSTSQLIWGPWYATTNLAYTNIPIATNIYIICPSNPPCYTNIIIDYTNVVIGTNFVTNALGRITMAISPSDPNTLYVGIAEPRIYYISDLQGIWVTTNAWADAPDWSQLPAPPLDHGSPKLTLSSRDVPRLWYMFDLLVHPANPAVLYLAEFNVWHFGSGTWTTLADWDAVHVHPDNHAMAWVPAGGPYRMLLGNDGGVYRSDAGVSGQWTSRNPGLRITEFYKGAVDPTGQNVVALGGAQDEFTSLYTGAADWPVASGGDGGDCAIAATDPLKQWALSSQTGPAFEQSDPAASIFRTLAGNSPKDHTWTAKDINDVLPISSSFYVHFEKAPYNDDLFIAGTARLWRCTNFFSGVPAWSTNSPTMEDTNGAPVTISAMAFAPSHTGGTVYAFGSQDGRLRLTTDAGLTWADLDPAGVLPHRYVSGLAFSPTDMHVLYVTFSGFDESTPSQPGHLFKTTNAFAVIPAWSNVSPPVNLPNNCLAIDPNNAQNVFVGADIGVWNSFYGGNSWFHYGPASGMPNVAVYDLRFNSASQVTAFTHGRGAYLLAKINIPIISVVWDNFHPTPNCLTCPPDGIWLNPGDLVSVEIPLRNILPIDTVDLTATILPSAQIRPVSGTQEYGVLKGQGAAVSRTFKFVASGGTRGPGPSGSSCGSTVQVVLQLSDQGTDLGQVSIPYRLGTPSHPLVEDFEEGGPALPPGWTSAATGADAAWTTTTNDPPNLPDLGEDDFSLPQPANTSVFIPDSPGNGQSFLISPPFTVGTDQAQLYFREAFAVSNRYDGCILEIAVGTQPFQEITQAGGSFVKDGYNVTLNDFNPLGPRPAWSGDSGGWLPVLLNLPAAAAGQTVQLRWHFAGSRGMTDGAWFVDSVLVTEPVCLPPVSNPVILNPALRGNFFSFAINTVSNRNYIIEYKTDLAGDIWQTLQILAGNGAQLTITVPTSPDNQRFYRFRVQ